MCQHAMVHGIMRPNLCCIHHGCMCTRLHAQSLRSHSQPPCLGGSAAPVVSAVAQNSARSGGGSLTVMGLGFGTKDYTVSAMLSTAPCDTTGWVSSTSLLCRFGGECMGREHASVTISTVVGTELDVFSFDGPVASYLMGNVPHSGGASLVVYGLNFGSCALSVTVSLGTRICGSSSWTSPTSLKCASPVLSSPLGQSAVQVEGGTFDVATAMPLTYDVVGTSVSVFSFDAPIISDAKGNVPRSSGAAMTLIGLNFGSNNHSPSAVLSYLLCGTASWTSQTLLRCKLTGGSSAAGSVSVVTVSTVVGTGLGGFSFDSPVLSSAFLNLPRSGGASLSLMGMNFGSHNYTPTAAVGDDGLCSTSSWSSGSSVHCLSSAESSVYGDMYTTVSAHVGTEYALFSFDAPTISNLRENGASSGQSSVTVSGLNFGWLEHSGTTSISGALCRTTAWSSTTSLSCIMNMLSAAPLPSVVTVGSVLGTGAGVFSMDAPVVSHGIRNMPHTGRASVTLAGLHFGMSGSTPSVQLGAAICHSVSWQSSTILRCETPQLIAPANRAVSVTLSSTVGTGLGMLSFDAPLASVLLRNIPLTGGASVTLLGLNFGYVNTTASTSVASAACQSEQWMSQTSMRCLPAGLESVELVTCVTVVSVVGTDLGRFSFDSAVLSQIWRNTPHTGGSSVTVTGLNFGYSEYTATAMLSSAVCMTSSWASTTTVVCLSSSVYQSGAPAALTVGSLVSTGLQGFTFDGVHVL